MCEGGDGRTDWPSQWGTPPVGSNYSTMRRALKSAFAFFRGTCTRGIYDNMKTAVETVFIGKDRQFNRRFLRMCGHYLVEPTACTPASG